MYLTKAQESQGKFMPLCYNPTTVSTVGEKNVKTPHNSGSSQDTQGSQKEIERKWLPQTDFNVGYVEAHATKVEFIRQRYFHDDNDDKAVARVRQYFSVRKSKVNNARRLTVLKSEITTKCGMGIERSEHNVPIDEDLANNLMYPNADCVVIEKTRYTIPIEDQGLEIEVDVYEYDNRGLIHIEVEFPDRDTADAFEPLHWFGEEVTDDKRHTNSALQERPFTFWKENK